MTYGNSFYTARPLFDVASYARQGPGRRTHLSHADIELIRRTVSRAPEVMVKVLSNGGHDLKAVQRHFAYLSRKGELDLETDDSQALHGKGAEAALLADWDLDIEDTRRQLNLAPTNHRRPPRLVHKLMFSMPPGTPPGKVLQAVRHFAREEFGLQHRYAMVLHTDEPHPHVHMVVKAMSEQGMRLNIKKATLRTWRSEFARHLRELGVPANATERAVRGQIKGHKLDGIYRPMTDARRFSTHMEERVGAVAAELKNRNLRIEAGKEKLLETRRAVEQGWRAVGTLLSAHGQRDLSDQLNRFVDSMTPPRTDKEQIAAELLQHVKRQRTREKSIVR